jgi:tRNA-dihydrouridine synthase
MIGRAAIGYPWIFDEIKHHFKTGELLPEPTLAQRVEAAKNHLLWSIDWKDERVGILEMRRHYTNYFKGIQNFKPYRNQLVTLETLPELLTLFDEIIATYC